MTDMQKFGIVLLFVASTAAAQQPPHELFPSDYKPRPCTETVTCQSFTDVDFASAAFKFLLRDLEPAWLAAHDDEMKAMVKPYCVKRATCMTMPANEWWFCNDVYSQELRVACDTKFTPKSHDNVQCHTWVDTYSSGIDQRGSAEWKVTQECAKKLPQPTTPGKIAWWSVPAMIPADYTGNIRVFTVDADTHIPLMSNLQFENQIIYATDPPNGRPTSYYVFKWPRKLVRIPNAQGHTDVLPPMMTISAAGYEPVVVRVPTVVQKVNAKMSPQRLHAGANKITVTVTDASTGKPAEGQILLGDQTVGFANQPFELTLPKGKRPEVWLRSPYDAYSDVVLAPAN